MKPYLMFSSTEDREILVEFTNKDLALLAEIMADESTVRDLADFMWNWQGHDREIYCEAFYVSNEKLVENFAKNYNLPIVYDNLE